MALLHLENLPPRTSKGELLQFVCSNSKLSGDQVGKIDLRGTIATIEVPSGWESRLIKSLDGASLKERRLRAWTTDPSANNSSGEDHFQRLARWLRMESDAEARQTLENVQKLSPTEAEKRGNCLVGLVVTEESSGLGGRCILSLSKRNRTLSLPWNRLEPGAPVLLSPEARAVGDGWRGVVCEREEKLVRVAFNEPPDEDERAATYRLHLTNDEIARQRQLQALDRVRTAQRDRLAELCNIAQGQGTLAFKPGGTVTILDESLNPSQQDAVRFALSAEDLAVVHGPPGTGKTTTVVEIIRQAVRRGEKVLACAPSNLAVDNLLERLLGFGEKALRLGHPARVLPALRASTLDLMIEDHDDTKLARKLAKEGFALFRKAGKYTRAKPEPGARRDMRQEARALLADARRLEAQVVESILNGAAVVCATLTGLNSEILGQRQFDVAVIDEAGQSTEPACWTPLLRCRRVVLAGDHCQLPPTVVSQEAAREGFGISLMERLVNRYGTDVTRLLNVQYRMNAAIMTFSSQEFYDCNLQAHDSVAGHLLCDLTGVAANPLTQTPVDFIDTAGAGFDEQEESGGESRLNPQEAEFLCRKVHALLEFGVSATALAVIAPYAAQVRLLRERLPVAGLEIDSVDGFQGREKEAVLLSLVRSNPEGEVGFLADVRRMNVALTRARRKLIVIGDSATLSSHPFYKSLFTYFESIGAYHSVWEEAM